MNVQSLKNAIDSISSKMTENRDYLIELDQQNGDGDLGISMSSGFQAVKEMLAANEEADLGKLLLASSKTMNEFAPSSLGTILSFGMMGIAKSLKGKTEATLEETINALQSGLNLIMDKAGSKPGEKTILDALDPAIAALKEHSSDNAETAFVHAAVASAAGSENTKNMKAVHGRAAYYAEKSIGVLDGGSVVGKLLFEAISESLHG